MPIGLYYENILNHPLPIPDKKPEEPPSSTTNTEAEEKPKPSPRGRKPKDDKAKAASESTSPEEQVRVIFGSRLAGPAERAERLAAIRNQSRLIAGVLVPPRPEEPDNCCMNGCVNCVWDRYRDEMEEWSAANAEAERRLRAQEVGVAATTTSDSMAGASKVDSSMDDDGGRSWDVGNVAGQGAGSPLTKDFWDDDLYKNVPVGIREFMKQEKRLKEKHMREGTVGG
jgi:hypothetical protein